LATKIISIKMIHKLSEPFFQGHITIKCEMQNLQQAMQEGSMDDSQRTQKDDAGNRKTTEKNASKIRAAQRGQQADRRQIHVIYLLANIQVVIWLILSIVACVVNFALDLWLIVTLIGMIIGMAPVSVEPVSVVIPVSTNTVNILFLLQLRSANKRMDTIMDRVLGAG
jgi:hypothetical protein